MNPQPRNSINLGGAQAEGLFWAAKIMGLGLELGAMILLGWFLDSVLGTAPWLALAGTVLGLIVSFVHLLIMAKSTIRSLPTSSQVNRPIPHETDTSDERDENESGSSD